MTKSSKSSSPFPRVFLVVVLLIIAAGIWTLQLMSSGKDTDQISAYENTKSLIGGPFNLVNHKGEAVTEKTYAGSYKLIYFGYTYCPDVCPTELQNMTDALDLVPEEKLEKITPLFISVDPERDTVDIVAQYVTLFHDNLIGLTGTEEQVKEAKKAYKVYSAKVDDDGSQEYLVDHSSIIFLMDENNQYLRHFSYATPPEDIAVALGKMVK